MADYRRELDLIFQEIEEKERLQHQARVKHRMKFIDKHLSRIANPFVKRLDGHPELREGLMAELAGLVIKSADLDFDKTSS